MRRLLVFSGLCVVLAATALGETYVVYPDPHAGDFPSIQAAVDYVQDGDIIELGDGVFRGEGNRDVDYLGKEIVIRSQSGDPGTCIVDCEGSEADPHRGFYFYEVGPGAVLDGLTVRNGYHDPGGGIYLERSSPLISRCILLLNTAYYGGGIDCDSQASPTIAQCTFAGNRAWQAGGGLCI